MPGEPTILAGILRVWPGRFIVCGPGLMVIGASWARNRSEARKGADEDGKFPYHDEEDPRVARSNLILLGGIATVIAGVFSFCVNVLYTLLLWCANGGAVRAHDGGARRA